MFQLERLATLSTIEHGKTYKYSVYRLVRLGRRAAIDTQFETLFL